MRVVYSLFSGEKQEIKRIWTITLGKKGNVHIYYTDGKVNHEKTVRHGRDFDHFTVYQE